MPRVLLVDDDEVLRDTLRQMLESDGHQVVEAAEGGQALRALAAGRFELMVTDILMPGMDGTRLIIEARQLRPDLAVLAISGGRRMITSTFNLETANLLGANAQLAKPFTLQALREAVATALRAVAPMR